MTIYQETGSEDRTAGSWRAIGSAWLLVLLGLGLFAGFTGLATRCEAWSRSVPAVEQVIVPQHDPACDTTAPCPAGLPFAAAAPAFAPM